MFTKDDKAFGKDSETIIGQTVKVRGDFNGEGNVVIEGEFEGSLKTTSNVLFGEKSKVIASVEASDAKILGEVIGNISLSGYLEIGSTGNIQGDIKASSIYIAKGAIINGKLTMKTKAEVKPGREETIKQSKTE